MRQLFIFSVGMLLLVGAWSVKAGTETANGRTWTYSISSDGATITGVSPETGDLVIPSSLGDYPVVSIGYYAFSGCSELTSVIIPEGVKKIDKFAFSDCSGLNSVEIPASVTMVGYRAFYGTEFVDNSEDGMVVVDGCLIEYKGSCPSNLVIPNGVRMIAADAFCDCRGLSSVKIPTSVKYINEAAFSGCVGLSSVTLPDGVIDIGEGAFSGCSGLTSVTIPDSVRSVGYYAFNGCSRLTRVDIADLAKWCAITFGGMYANPLSYAASSSTKQLRLNGNVITDLVVPSGVTHVGANAFRGCNGLTSVTIPASVMTIGDAAFSECSGLTAVIISANSMSIGASAFSECNKLSSVTIPNGVMSVGDGSFAGCSKLTSVAISPSVTNIGSYAFSRCSKLTSVTIPSLPNIKESFADSYKSITHLSISDGETQIDEGAFSDFIGVTTLDIPTSVMSIGGKAFSGCSGLTEITIPLSVLSIGYGAFSGCSSITNFSLPFVGSRRGITETSDSCFGYIFGAEPYAGGKLTKQYYSANSAADYYIPESLKEVTITDENIMAYGAFFACKGLLSVAIPASVTNIACSAFGGCSGLLSMTIPASVKRIGESAFSGCSGLSSVTFHEGVLNIGDSAFRGCSGLISMRIPSSVKSIGANAFERCSALTSVEIYEGVKSIGGYAFSSCESLMQVTIPSSIANIGDSAFTSCDMLTRVDITDLVRWCEIAFGNYKANPLCRTAKSSKRLYLNGLEIKELEIPDGVVRINDYAFYGWDLPTAVSIPTSVTSIGCSAFGACLGLTSVHIADLTKWCNVSFDDVGANPLICAKHLYLNGEEIRNLVIPDGVRSVSDFAFEYCSGLMSVTMPPSVTNFGVNTFKYCNGLTSVRVSEGVSYIGCGAFEGCSSMINITLPFVGSTRGNEETAESLFGWIFGTENYGGGIKTEQQWSGGYRFYYIPESLTSVVITDEMKFGYGAFGGCSGLKSVTISANTTEIDKFAFYGCKGLTSILVGGSGGKYCSVDGVLYNSTANTLFMCPMGCGGVVIPAGVRGIDDYAFHNCIELRTVIIPDSVTSIGEYAFSGCGKLTSVILPEGVISIGAKAFYDCGKLASVEMPSSVKSVGGYSFAGCGLVRVDILDLRKWCAISFDDYYANPLSCGKHLYLNGVEIKELLVPQGVTDVGNCAFCGCSGLTAAVIPSGVTRIGWSAFEGCSKMASVTIPASVMSIGGAAFYGCSGLTTVCVSLGDVDRVKKLLGDSMSRLNLDAIDFIEVLPPQFIADDEGVTVTGDAETGFVVKPSEGKTAVEVTIPQGVDAAKVTVEVSPKVATVKPNGAKVKIVVGENDITDYLIIPESGGVLNIADATVREEVVKETLDPSKDAVIELNAANPRLTTAPTRKGLTYTLFEGHKLESLSKGDFIIGNGDPWKPTITVSGGDAAFYSIGVGKGE